MYLKIHYYIKVYNFFLCFHNYVNALLDMCYFLIFSHKFKHKTYVKVSTGLIMQVQAVSVTLSARSARSLSLLLQLFCTCQQFKMAKPKEEIKTGMFSQKHV